ncbi:LOW QUALITY PROTEIN: hypothetical protein HID58_052454 [Brassica napus]|uniref:Uncharacterized protein n=1 Tax=Brassica napus TaxID=3708 RepID=A0ABQ8ABV4_BRANA|nr:LOW QUALITY PROTEIN: hypothetical protein HID58_052454 [Brassica napus]
MTCIDRTEKTQMRDSSCSNCSTRSSLRCTIDRLLKTVLLDLIIPPHPVHPQSNDMRCDGGVKRRRIHDSEKGRHRHGSALIRRRWGLSE